MKAFPNIPILTCLLLAIAHLHAQDVNWDEGYLSCERKKTGQPVIIYFGQKAARVLHTRPQSGPLCPYLCTVRAGDRATEFKQRCVGLGITGVSLHAYRLLLLMGFNESTGVVPLDSGKLTRCQIQNPGRRPRNLTGRWQEGLRVTTEMENAELRPEI